MVNKIISKRLSKSFISLGLTFQTAADARAFDKGVKIAVDDLLAGKSGYL